MRTKVYSRIKELSLSSSFLLGVSGVLGGLFFFIDLALPLGIAASIPYVAIVLLGMWLPNWKYMVSLAILASFLTVLGYLISDPGTALIVALTNRALTLLIIWATVSLIVLKARAEERTKLAASVFDTVREGITISNAMFEIIDVNDYFTEVTGYSREEVIGQSPRMLQSPDKQSPRLYTEMWQTINTIGYWTGEVWNQRKNGEIYPANLTKSAVKDTAGKVTHYVALFSDITRQKDHQNQLERMANYDVLTNLPNRILLADRLSQAILQANATTKNSLLDLWT